MVTLVLCSYQMMPAISERLTRALYVDCQKLLAMAMSLLYVHLLSIEQIHVDADSIDKTQKRIELYSG